MKFWLDIFATNARTKRIKQMPPFIFCHKIEVELKGKTFRNTPINLDHVITFYKTEDDNGYFIRFETQTIGISWNFDNKQDMEDSLKQIESVL